VFFSSCSWLKSVGSSRDLRPAAFYGSKHQKAKHVPRRNLPWPRSAGRAWYSNANYAIGGVDRITGLCSSTSTTIFHWYPYWSLIGLPCPVHDSRANPCVENRVHYPCNPVVSHNFPNKNRVASPLFGVHWWFDLLIYPQVHYHWSQVAMPRKKPSIWMPSTYGFIETYDFERLHLQYEAPKIAKLVYNFNNYGLWYL